MKKSIGCISLFSLASDSKACHIYRHKNSIMINIRGISELSIHQNLILHFFFLIFRQWHNLFIRKYLLQYEILSFYIFVGISANSKFLIHYNFFEKKI